MIKWEYCTLNNTNESEVSLLKRKGEEGWELVSVVCGNTPYSPTTFYFKRPIPEPNQQP